MRAIADDWRTDSSGGAGDGAHGVTSEHAQFSLHVFPLREKMPEEQSDRLRGLPTQRGAGMPAKGELRDRPCGNDPEGAPRGRPWRRAITLWSITALALVTPVIIGTVLVSESVPRSCPTISCMGAGGTG